MNVVLCSKFLSPGYVKDILSLIDPKYTIYQYTENYSMTFQLHAPPSILIFGNAMNEKKHTLQLKASSQLFNRRVVSFLDINETIDSLFTSGFEIF